ncbi:hypothetical protein [Methylopila sp. M107]|uniref:hypothetical protein n=1 Tax=Methylopila sp. M107 TaxID=1101190 RepID=UPI00035F56A5|nr:hypothetical protein [Methylopila sp. M107]
MLNTFCDITMLAAESQHVVGLRLGKIALGGQGAFDELLLMCSEKIIAAGTNGMRIMAGVSFDEVVEDYRNIVQANAVRLSNH